ncbi:MAG: hypothetical protein ACPLUL_02505 [Thermanaerothrix sp.]|jgi:hypothetical protein|uniref:DUF2802 domain-containing protein n=1 Tax=Thermanaerothrix solaris TaxID=3058434 RepID=A0ABU3NLE1_9CHLR|nr:hypothetical protein [Thermanaerothrix sp. 4228-RoL]MDT8897665.1 hypothetical protein [Thermanaerothrix sp. 4228-RoL]
MKVSENLLLDTYHLLQLARETALAQGNAERAERLSPVVNELRNLVIQNREPPSAQPTGIMSGQDFQTLLSITSRSSSLPVQGSPNQERYQAVLAMAAANMNETDIARHLGMTLEEVRTLLQIAQPRSTHSME